MAFVDHHFIWSGKYAKLKPSSRILLHVITGVCNHQTGEFYHSVETLAHLSGISERATRYALRELESQKPPIISSEPRAKQADRKVHLPTARFTDQAKGANDSTMGANIDTRRGQQMPPNNRKQQQTKTTTAADRISPSLIAELSEIYGAKAVLGVVVSMRSMDGEVKNANAYFRTCVTKGWIPTSAKARKKQKELERKRAAERRREEREKERRDLEARIAREAADPQAQKRIQTEMDKIFAMLDD
jgi:hypothetical protein